MNTDVQDLAISAREEIGFTINQISRACGVHRNTWGKWVSGDRTPDKAAVQLIRALVYMHRIGKLDKFLASLVEV